MQIGRKRSRPSPREPPPVEDLRALVIQTARLALQTSREVRTQSAAIYTVLILPANHPCAEAMATMGKQYYDAKKSTPKSSSSAAPAMAFTGPVSCHDFIGAPHHFIWAALVQSASTLPHVSAEALSAMKQHMAQTPSPSVLQDLVHVCHLNRSYNGAWRFSLSVATTLQPLLGHLVSTLTANGCELKHGGPPSGACERQVAQSLRKLGEEAVPAFARMQMS